DTSDATSSAICTSSTPPACSTARRLELKARGDTTNHSGIGSPESRSAFRLQAFPPSSRRSSDSPGLMMYVTSTRSVRHEQRSDAETQVHQQCPHRGHQLDSASIISSLPLQEPPGDHRGG